MDIAELNKAKESFLKHKKERPNSIEDIKNAISLVQHYILRNIGWRKLLEIEAIFKDEALKTKCKSAAEGILKITTPSSIPIEDLLTKYPEFILSIKNKLPPELQRGFYPYWLTTVLILDEEYVRFNWEEFVRNESVLSFFGGLIGVITRLARSLVFLEHFGIENWERDFRTIITTNSDEEIYSAEFVLFIVAFLATRFRGGLNDESKRRTYKTPDFVLRDEKATFFGECKKLRPYKRPDLVKVVRNRLNEANRQIESRKYETTNFPGAVFINIPESVAEPAEIEDSLMNKKGQFKGFLFKKRSLFSYFLLQWQISLIKKADAIVFKPTIKTYQINSTSCPHPNAEYLKKRLTEIIEPDIVV